MPQIEKTLRMDLETLEKKIHLGFAVSSPLTYKRGRWETTVGGVKSVLIVYEKHDKKEFVKPSDPPEWMEEWDKDYKPDWFNICAREYFQQKPHYSISIMLVEQGGEIRLCAITSGSGQEQYFLPDSGAEYSLYETLDIILENLDRILV